MACRVERNEKGSITQVNAPNGKPSVLFQSLLKHYDGNVEKAIKGYALTHTPTFREWFGNSAVVDENGEPQVWYHDMSGVRELTGLRELDEVKADAIAEKLMEQDYDPQILADLGLTDGAVNIPLVSERPAIDRGSLLVQEALLSRLTDGTLNAVTARPVYIRAAIKPEGNTATAPNMDFIRLADTIDTYATDTDDTLYMPDVSNGSIENVPAGCLAKVVNLKENLKDNARKRMAEIGVLIDNMQEADREQIKALHAEHLRLQDYIYGDNRRGLVGLKEEIKKIEKIDSRHPDALRPYVEKEFNRIEALLSSGDVREVKEAEEILEFLVALGDVRMATDHAKATQTHPIFEKEELYSKDGTFLLPEEWAKVYQDWKEKAEGLQVEHILRSEELALQIINANPNVQKFYGSLNRSQVLGGDTGFKDITYVDYLFYNPASGIWNFNGVIPQIAQIVINEEFIKEEAWNKYITDKMDGVLPAAIAELKRRGETMLNFMGMKIPKFTMFRQEDRNGVPKSSLISKYSYEWQDAYKNMIARFMKMKSDVEDSQEGRKKKKMSMADVYEYRNEWLKNNTMMMNPALIPEIAARAEELELDDAEFGTPEEQEAHKKALIARVGEDHYKKLVKEQEQKIIAYQAKRQAVLEGQLQKEKKVKEEDLEDDSKLILKLYELENDPFHGAAYSESGTPTEILNHTVHSRFSNNIHVPARDMYYDKAYAEVEKNKALKDFYDVVFEATSGIWNRLDYDMQKKYSKTSILNSRKGKLELFLDGDLTMLQAMSEVLRRMIDGVKGAFGVVVEDPVTGARTNATTGVPEAEINAGFIRNNEVALKQRTRVKSLALMLALNKSSHHELNKIGKSTILSVGQYPNLISQLLKHTGLTREQIMDPANLEYRFDNEGNEIEYIRVGKLMEVAAVREIARESSFDLPSILKLYTNLSAQYAARKRVKPIIENLRSLYFKTMKPETTSSDEVRTRRKNPVKGALPEDEEKDSGVILTKGRPKAEAQFDNWMQRVVLGHMGLKKNYLVASGPETDQDYQDAAGNTLGNFFRRITGRAERFHVDGKIYSFKDKKDLAVYNEAITKARNKVQGLEATLKAYSGSTDTDLLANTEAKLEAANVKLVSMEKARARLGKNLAGSALMDGFLNVVRFAFLNYNIKAAANNVVIGQIANRMTAASGAYFPPEYLDELGMAQMLYTDFMRANPVAKLRRKLVPERGMMGLVLSEDYNMLQDNSNELQKSALKSQFKGLRRFTGFYLQKKGEYYNQVPLMMAVLKDTPIYVRDEDGQIVKESNVLDELEMYFDTDARKWKKKLKDEFRSDENIESWENGNSNEFATFKARINDVISDTHGDYDPLKGMAIKTTAVGQPAMVFKTFLPRVLSMAFARPHDSIITGIQGKQGFLKGNTKLTAALLAAGLGAATLGLPGAGVMAAVGFTAGAVWGKKTQMGMLEEMWYVTKLLARKMSGVALNPISRAITGKRFYTRDMDAEFQKMSNGKKFTRADYQSYQMNVQLVLSTLAYIAGQLLVHAAWWDDDDDDESAERKAYNFFTNEITELLNNSTMILNPSELGRTITSLAVLRWIGDLGKTLVHMGDYLMGDDMKLSGTNVGESKFGAGLYKLFLPRIAEDMFGFGPAMAKQFEVTPFDKYFWSDEKKAQRDIRELKIERAEQLRELYPDLDDTIFKKKLNKDFGKKRKGETYVDFLKRLKNKPNAPVE